MLEHLHAQPIVPKRTVIIGAGGFVGGSILRELAREGAPVLGLTRLDLDFLSSGAAENLAGILLPDDSVVFVSALAPTRTPAMLIQNLQMAAAVTEAIAKRNVAHLVYISSDAVYADDTNPVTETSSAAPSSLHGMMHAARELILKTQVKAPLAILRPSLLYGAADPHNGYGPNRFRRLAEKGESITLFGDGEEKRDHVFIGDVGQLAALVLAHLSVGVLNIATGVSVSFREVAEAVSALYPSRVAVQGTPRQNPISHRHFDIAACLKAFPRFRYVSVRDGLARVAKSGST